MSDHLMQQLCGLAREDDALLAQLEALIAGTISEDDRRALETRAADDEELRELLEGCAPLGEAARARISARASATLTASRSSGSAPVVSLAARRRRAFVAAGAMAAAVLLAVLVLGRGATLPDYRLELGGGDRQLRSEGQAGPVPRFSAGSRLEVVLRPARAVEGAVRGSAFVVDAAGVHELAARFEPASGGALRLVTRAGELIPDVRGPVTLGFVVGAGGALPTAERAWAAARDDSDTARTWRVLTVQIELDAP